MMKKLPLGLIGLIAFAALAEESPSAENSVSEDKSSYILFNPTPDDLMRSFAPDRPTKLNSPYTIDAGHFSYEVDIVNWTYDRYNTSKVTTSNFVIADPAFKLGLTNNIDVELVVSSMNVNSSNDRNSGVQSTFSGFGDTYARVKFNLLGNDGGNYAFAVVPYIKAPSASHPVGNQYWEGGGYAPFTVTMPHNWSLTFQTEIDLLENAALDGMHMNFQNAISIGHPLIFDDLMASVDLWSLADGDKGSYNQYTTGVSFAFAVTNNLQLDSAINIGLNKAAPDMQPYIGISQRF